CSKRVLFDHACYSTITQSLLLRLNTSGEYISYALVGGTTNVPGVLALYNFLPLYCPSCSTPTRLNHAENIIRGKFKAHRWYPGFVNSLTTEPKNGGRR
ncbi:MAG: hypothetical protein PVF74_07965, partial [Anaerolineales bacterium]